MKRQYQVIADHTPGDLELGTCGCNINVLWSPEHVLDELNKIGWRLVAVSHLASYVDAGNKYLRIMLSARELARAWRAGADASSPPEFETYERCASQLEEAMRVAVRTHSADNPCDDCAHLIEEHDSSGCGVIVDTDAHHYCPCEVVR